MAQTASTMMLPLGANAPSFELPDPSGRTWSLAGFDGSPALLVAFICNHCPFVKHVRAGFASLAAEYRKRGVAVVAIASNDAQAYPEDGPEGMAEEAKAAGYTFPYLFDETPGGGEGLRRRVHAGLLPLRPRAAALLPRADGRQPARQRRAGDRGGPAGGARRGARGPARRRRSSGRASAATSSGSRGTSRRTSRAEAATPSRRTVSAGGSHDRGQPLRRPPVPAERSPGPRSGRASSTCARAWGACPRRSSAERVEELCSLFYVDTADRPDLQPLLDRAVAVLAAQGPRSSASSSS